MIIDPSKNTIVCGDNIEWLKWIPNGSVDFCYIDPPFFSNRVYEVIWGNGYELRSFDDRFAGGIKHYADWIKDRLELIYPKLSERGSIFVHCDWNASHRIRVVLDEIFGEQNCRNVITWKRCDTHNDAKRQFPVVTDHLLFYSKSDKYYFKKQHIPYPEKTLKDWYLYLEMPDGSTRKMTAEERETQKIPKGSRRFNTGDLSSPNPRPNLVYDYKGYKPHKNGWRVSKEKMKELDKDGLLLFPNSKDGRIMFKRYLDEQEGPLLGDLWSDIEFLRGNSSESMGYKTQKPETLIKRIIDCACPEGGLVLDCFAGGGTTAKAALEINRRFIVGDVSPVAVKIMADRLNRDCPSGVYNILNLPTTVEEFQALDGHDFAERVCSLMGWECNSKKSNDGGIDGWDAGGNPIQIKNRSNSGVGRADIQKFHSAVRNEKKKRGIFVAWTFAKPAMEYIAQIKADEGIEIIAKDCSEIFGALIIPHDKAENIKKLYKERLPKSWTGNSDKKPESNIEETIADIVDQESAHKMALEEARTAKKKAKAKKPKSKTKTA